MHEKRRIHFFQSGFKPLSEEETEVDYDGEENSTQPEDKSSKKIPKNPRQPDDEGDEFINTFEAAQAKKPRSSSSSASSSLTTVHNIEKQSVGGMSDGLKRPVGTDRTDGEMLGNSGENTPPHPGIVVPLAATGLKLNFQLGADSKRNLFGSSQDVHPTPSLTKVTGSGPSKDWSQINIGFNRNDVIVESFPDKQFTLTLNEIFAKKELIRLASISQTFSAKTRLQWFPSKLIHGINKRLQSEFLLNPAMLQPLFSTIDGVVQLQTFWEMEHEQFWDLLALLNQEKIANDHGELVAMKAAILQIPITLTAKKIDDFEDYSNKIDNVFADYSYETPEWIEEVRTVELSASLIKGHLVK